MNGENTGPIINSRHDGNMPKGNKGVFVIAALAFMIALGASGFFLIVNKATQAEETIENKLIQQEELLNESEDVGTETIEEIEQPISEIETKEEGTVDFFYQRALTKEKAKDYEGAVKDYTRTIEDASRYSVEMWNALNNRGIINAKQFKDYKAALKDFNKIVEIETNRSDGNINATRLEAGYTNRAYVKKMRGDKQGACDDLYDALGLGIPSSVKFIEKQIANNCD